MAKININQRQLLQLVRTTFGNVFLFVCEQWMGHMQRHTLHKRTVPSLLSSRTKLFPVGSRGRFKVELEARLIFSSVCSIGRSGTSWLRRSLRQQMEATSGSNAIKRFSGHPGSQRPAWQWKERENKISVFNALLAEIFSHFLCYGSIHNSGLHAVVAALVSSF